MTELEAARIAHHKHTVSAAFKEHIEKCADIFGVPQSQRTAYFRHLVDSLENVQKSHDNHNAPEDETNNDTQE